MSIRLSKVASQMMREISAIVSQDLSDPRLRGFTTVSNVDPAPDLKTAKVYYSVIGSDIDRKMTTEVLKTSRGHIQRLLAKRLHMKSTPVLSFIYDDGSQKSVDISQMVHEEFGTDEEYQDMPELMGDLEEGDPNDSAEEDEGDGV